MARAPKTPVPQAALDRLVSLQGLLSGNAAMVPASDKAATATGAGKARLLSVTPSSERKTGDGASEDPDAYSPDEAAAYYATSELVDYQPPDPQWIQKEEALLQRLQQKYGDPERLRAQLEPEPPGIDTMVLVRPSDTVIDEVTGKGIPLARPELLREVQVGTQIRKGYDLVRIGNFAEREDMLQVTKYAHQIECYFSGGLH
jgi:hypothetical protein